MKKHLISIVIPVFNEENYQKLTEKVNSVQNIDKEIIIINDGSSDNTYEIIIKDCKNLYNKLINLEK